MTFGQKKSNRQIKSISNRSLITLFRMCEARTEGTVNIINPRTTSSNGLSLAVKLTSVYNRTRILRFSRFLCNNSVLTQLFRKFYASKHVISSGLFSLFLKNENKKLFIGLIFSGKQTFILIDLKQSFEYF